MISGVHVYSPGGADRAVLGADSVRRGGKRSSLLRRGRQRTHAHPTQLAHTEPRLVRPHSLPLHATIQPHEGNLHYINIFIYPVSPKRPPFYFLNNSVKNEPISMILSN